jgi:hypothetical protein
MFRHWQSGVVLAAVIAGLAHAADMKVSFAGNDYVHRWSRDGQHEFTPPSEPDLTKWQHMVTFNVHDKVKNGEQLAQLANNVLANYQRAGKIMGTGSKPRTKDSEAQHFIVGILAAPGVVEAVFARVMLAGGIGLVVVYSQREYGPNAPTVVGEWLQKNGAATEKTLMTWDKLPRIAELRALPQSK